MRHLTRGRRSLSREYGSATLRWPFVPQRGWLTMPMRGVALTDTIAKTKHQVPSSLQGTFYQELLYKPVGSLRLRRVSPCNRNGYEVTDSGLG
jgi:hypothetical protein